MSAVWPLQSGTVINIHGLPYEVLGNVQVRGVVDPATSQRAVDHQRYAAELMLASSLASKEFADQVKAYAAQMEAGNVRRAAMAGLEHGKIVADGQSARPERDRHETEMQASQQAHDAAMRRYDAKSGIIRDVLRDRGGKTDDQVLAEADRLYAWLIESDEAAKERAARPANRAAQAVVNRRCADVSEVTNERGTPQHQPLHGVLFEIFHDGVRTHALYEDGASDGFQTGSMVVNRAKPLIDALRATIGQTLPAGVVPYITPEMTGAGTVAYYRGGSSEQLVGAVFSAMWKAMPKA